MTNFLNHRKPVFTNFRSTIARVNDKSRHGYILRSFTESIFAALIWFGIALIRALPEGLSSKIPILNLENTASAENVRKAWGQGDAGSLLDIAITWANFEKLDPITQYWIPGLWSPGLAIIEVPLIWISRIGVPIYWSLLFLTLTIWSILFSLIWRNFSHFTGRIPMALVSIGILWSWDFVYLLKDYIFYTEGIGFGLLFIGLILLTIKALSPEKTSSHFVYLAGLLIGVSIWIRHTNETGLILFLIISCFSYLRSSQWSKQHSKKRQKNAVRAKHSLHIEKQNISPKSFYRIGMLSSCIALLVTLPWRLISTFHFQGAPFLMSSASGGVPSTIWALPSSASGQYWGTYGSNWACKIDLETCNLIQSGITDGSLSRSHLFFLAFRSAFLNPIEYIQERSHFLWANWIPNFSINSDHQNLVAISFFVLAIYCLWLCVTIEDKRKFVMISIWCSFLLMNLAQLSIIHYESRYFIPVRLLLLGLLLSLLSLKNERNESKPEPKEN